jgi:hypothetical protein
VTGVHIRGFASPASFRLQGFAPSWRLAPPETVRACFIPVALVGSSALRSSPLLEIAAASSVAALPACRWPRRARLPGVDPSRSPLPDPQGLTRGTARGFHGLGPLQGLPVPARTFADHPPTGFRRVRRNGLTRAPRSSACEVVGFLSRGRRPSWGSRAFSREGGSALDPVVQCLPPTGMPGPRMDSEDAGRLPLRSPLRHLATADQRSGDRQLAVLS